MRGNYFKKLDEKWWYRILHHYTRLKHPHIENQTASLLTYMTRRQKKAQARLASLPPKEPLNKNILIVIPFRDRWDLTEKCLASLTEQDFQGNRIMTALVDNGSQEEATRQGIKKYLSRSNDSLQFRHLRYDISFNFSTLNNRAVEDCSDFMPDLIFFLNNDIEFIDNTSVVKFSRFFDRADRPGAVGCTLLYKDRSIQHLFVAPGQIIVGAHPLKKCPHCPDQEWYREPRPVGAVTGAALMVKSSAFTAAGGFEEELSTAYQDVDLCLKFQQQGRVNWTLPHVSLIHHETQTRHIETDWNQVKYIYAKWGRMLYRNPWLSFRISRWSEQILISPWPRNFPWWRLQK